MNSLGRGRVVAGGLFLLVMGVASIVVIAALRHWRSAVTSADIPIITGLFSVASTTLAYLSARASRAAASDSRKALLLHFRPEDLRAAFSVRDPADPNAQMGWTSVPSPAPLWLTFSPFGVNPVEQYTVTWVDASGVAVAPREITLGPGDEKHLRLDGVTAEEDTSSGIREIVGALERLTVECRDEQANAKWKAERRWPRSGPLGSYKLVFDLDE